MSLKVHFTPEQSNEIVKAYSQGDSQRKIARRLGVSQKVCGAELKRHGVTSRDNSKLTPEQKEAICQAYQEGQSAAQIAALIGCDKATCLKWLRQSGINLRSANGKSTKASLSAQREAMKVDFVSGIGCPEIAAKYGLSHTHVIRVLRAQGFSISNNQYSPEQEQELIDFYFGNEVDGVDTALHFDCSVHTVSRILKRHGLKRKKRLSVKASAKAQGIPLYKWEGYAVSPWDRFKMSPEYKDWRSLVFRRDNFTCADCGQRGCRIEAHHIFRKSKFPHLALEVRNGVTLCKECHEAIKDKEEEHAPRYLDKIGSTVAPLLWFDEWTG